jgi:glycerate kinase
MVDCSSFSLSNKAWLRLPDNGSVAVLEMAQSSGLSLLKGDERNLWHTSSYGAGEILSLAIKLNPALIIMGLGGSATHDLGLGALEAMGLRFRAQNGDPIPHITPHQWSEIAAIEGDFHWKNIPRIILAPNTQNKLLGSHGAAALFGPQKGLKHNDYGRLEEGTQRMAELITGHFGAPRSIVEAPGSGSAGGMSVGLQSALNIEMIPGIELSDRWLRLNESIERANIVITGEGKFDMGSLEGKGPEYVITRAANRGKRLYCFVEQFVAGDRNSLPPELSEAKILTTAPQNISPEEAAKDSVEYLGEAVKRAFAEIR